MARAAVSNRHVIVREDVAGVETPEMTTHPDPRANGRLDDLVIKRRCGVTRQLSRVSFVILPSALLRIHVELPG